MSRDQRVNDNWALLRACEIAQGTGAPVIIAFNLVCIKPSLEVQTKININLSDGVLPG